MTINIIAVVGCLCGMVVSYVAGERSRAFTPIIALQVVLLQHRHTTLNITTGKTNKYNWSEQQQRITLTGNEAATAGWLSHAFHLPSALPQHNVMFRWRICMYACAQNNPQIPSNTPEYPQYQPHHRPPIPNPSRTVAVNIILFPGNGYWYFLYTYYTDSAIYTTRSN